jgi:hypothetical protein
MPRFKSNRWWAFVLTLGLLLVSVVASHAQSRGPATSAFVTNGDSGNNGGSLNPPPIGDPDNPTGTKSLYGVGRMGPTLVPGSSVGDGRALGRGWTMWLGTLLQITRLRLFGI